MQPASYRLAHGIRLTLSTARCRPRAQLLGAEFRTLLVKHSLYRPPNRRQGQGLFSSQRPYADSKSGQHEADDQSPHSSSDSAPNNDHDASSTTIPLPQQPHELPSHSESRRTDLSKRLSFVMDNIQSNLFAASRRLNDLTGYSGIEALKKSIEKQEELVFTTRQAVKAARAAYSASVATRSETQREVNDLLQRKHNWTPSDLERFTSLYRSDHTNEQAEQRAHDELARCERAAEEASNALAKSILARYHEEQIWSDKIRRMSTWGTWGLMGVNILLFLVFQVAVEPWRRKRLVKGFEEKVMEALERVKEGGPSPTLPNTTATEIAAETENESNPTDHPGRDTTDQPTTQAAVLNEANLAAAVSVVDAVIPTIAETQPSPAPSSFADTYKSALSDLFSESKVLVLSQRDLTSAMMQGAAGGAALMGLVLVLLRPR